MGVGTNYWCCYNDRRSLMEVLNEIFGKKDIQGPIQRDSQLLFCSGKFEQVDCAPEPPGHKARKVDAENTSNAGTPADRCQQTKSIKSERDQVFAACVRDDVACEHLAFPRGVLRGGWLIPATFIGNHGTVTERPNTRISLDSHRSVNLEPLPLLWKREFFEQRVRSGTSSPNQSKTLNSGSVGEFDFSRRNCFDFGVRPDLYTPLGEFAARIASELFAKLRQNDLTRMYQHYSNHLGFQIG